MTVAWRTEISWVEVLKVELQARPRAGSVGVGVARLVEQAPRRLGVVGDRRQAVVARPEAHRQDRLAHRPQAAPQSRHQPLAVDAERDGAPHAPVAQDRVLEVEPEIAEARAGALRHLVARVVAEGGHRVRRQVVDHHLHRALAQLEHPHRGVGDLAQDQPRQARRAAPVARKGLERDGVRGAPREAEGAGADRPLVHLFRRHPAGDDRQAARQLGEQGSEGLAQVEVDGVGIDHRHALERGERPALRGRHGAVEDGADRPRHVLGAERRGRRGTPRPGAGGSASGGPRRGPARTRRAPGGARCRRRAPPARRASARRGGSSPRRCRCADRS